MKNILSDVLPLTVTIISIGFFFRIIFKSFKKSLSKQLSEFGNFKLNGEIPVQLQRIAMVQFGQMQRFNNIMQLGERDRTLYVKLPFQIKFALPFSVIQSVKAEDSGHLWKVVSLGIVDHKEVIKIWLSKQQLGQFPELMNMAGMKERSESKKNEISISQNNYSTETDRINNDMILQKASNSARILVLIIALIVAGLMLGNFYLG